MASVLAARPVIGRLRALGCDVDGVLATAGTSAKVLEDPDARIPQTVCLSIWREAVRRSGDDAFGIHAAEQFGPEHLDMLGYAFWASPTLGEALRRIVRYIRILNDVAVIQLDIKGDRACLTHSMPAEVGLVPRHAAEFILAAMLIAARKATAADFAPLEVKFRHAQPEDLTEHRRIFRAPLRFAQPANQLVISRALLDRPLIKSDPGLSAMLDRCLGAALERIPSVTTLSGRVRHLLAIDLTGTVGVESVAQKLHMSRRTLHRQLADEGTSFRQLLDDLRRELATRYLSESRMATATVAFLVGFSEPSAFHRAFKRWYRTTPAEYRQGSRYR